MFKNFIGLALSVVFYFFIIAAFYTLILLFLGLFFS